MRGHTDCAGRWLTVRADGQKTLVERIPRAPDAPRAWLLLLLCAGPCAVHVLRNYPPADVGRHTRRHNVRTMECLARTMEAGTTGRAREVAQLPFL